MRNRLPLLLICLGIVLAPACARTKEKPATTSATSVKNAEATTDAAGVPLPPEFVSQQKVIMAELAKTKTKLREGGKVTGANTICAYYFMGALAGDEELLGLLKKSGAAIDTTNTLSGESALQAAVLEGSSTAAVARLVAHGANVNMRDGRGKPILYMAIGSTTTETLKVLLDHGADPNAYELVFGQTPLLATVVDNKLAEARLLLEHGANPNLGTRDTGATPLHFAAMMGRKEMAELLLQHGANPNAKTKVGTTPLKAATANRKTELMELLKKHGAE